MSKPISPYLAVQQIQDIYVRENFKALQSYFTEQNQLFGFKHLEYVFSAAATVQISHGLAFIPQDILVTKLIGPGSVTFNYSSFTSSTVSITSTDACRVRFYVGTYWKDESTVTDADGSTATYSTSAASSSSTSSVPTGTILEYAGSSLPTGFLWCDGTSYPQSLYPSLYKAIGTAFGALDSVSFCVPDKRGVVGRGWDAMGNRGAAARDPNAATRIALQTGGATGNAIGSYQDDAFQDHRHGLSTTNNPAGSPGKGFVPAQGSFITKGVAMPDGSNNNNPGTWEASLSMGSNGTPRTTSETRMKNVYVGYIIKY